LDRTQLGQQTLETNPDCRDGFSGCAATIWAVNETRSVRGLGSGLSDPDAFRVFYDTALPVVYGYFFKRCGGRGEVAADLTQETFLSAVKAVRSGTTVEAPMPWIVSIARRRLVDFYRRKEGHPVPVGEWTEQPVTVGSQWTSGTETRLVSALEQVPADHRLVLVLRYVDDLPVAEVAQLIGRSLPATESLLARARRSLEAAFEEADDV
jgi:RNA polymerase sigma-70 factor, ECF subfamily